MDIANNIDFLAFVKKNHPKVNYKTDTDDTTINQSEMGRLAEAYNDSQANNELDVDFNKFNEQYLDLSTADFLKEVNPEKVTLTDVNQAYENAQQLQHLKDLNSPMVAESTGVRPFFAESMAKSEQEKKAFQLFDDLGKTHDQYDGWAGSTANGVKEVFNTSNSHSNLRQELLDFERWVYEEKPSEEEFNTEVQKIYNRINDYSNSQKMGGKAVTGVVAGVTTVVLSSTLGPAGLALAGGAINVGLNASDARHAGRDYSGKEAFVDVLTGVATGGILPVAGVASKAVAAQVTTRLGTTGVAKIVTSTATGATDGAIQGGATGFTHGSSQTLVDGGTVTEVIGNGLKEGVIGTVTGAVIGGGVSGSVSGGKSALAGNADGAIAPVVDDVVDNAFTTTSTVVDDIVTPATSSINTSITITTTSGKGKTLFIRSKEGQVKVEAQVSQDASTGKLKILDKTGGDDVYINGEGINDGTGVTIRPGDHVVIGDDLTTGQGYDVNDYGLNPVDNHFAIQPTTKPEAKIIDLNPGNRPMAPAQEVRQVANGEFNVVGGNNGASPLEIAHSNVSNNPTGTGRIIAPLPGDESTPNIRNANGNGPDGPTGNNGPNPVDDYFATHPNVRPGTIRPSSQLKPKDVVKALNENLKIFSKADLESLLSKYKGEDREIALQALNEMTEFGSLKSLKVIDDKVVKAYAEEGYNVVYTKRGTLAESLSYLKQKKVLSPVKIKSMNNSQLGSVNQKTVFIVDKSFMEEVRNNEVLLKFIQNEGNDVKLVCPRSWDSGINPFKQSSLNDMQTVLDDIVVKVKTSGDPDVSHAIDDALTDDARGWAKEFGIEDKLMIVKGNSPETLSIDNAYNNLLPPHASEKQVTELLKKMSDDYNLPPEYQQAALEMLEQSSRNYSPRSLSQIAQKTQGEILDLAQKKGIDPNKIYYWIPKPEKSYGIVGMIHKIANNIPEEQMITSADGMRIASKQEGSMIVLLDDVAGSGQSLRENYRVLKKGYKYDGEIVISPTVSSGTAAKVFQAIDDPKMSYKPGEFSPSLKDTPYYHSLTEEKQLVFDKLMGSAGWSSDGLNVSFPYMAPDNNNSFFAEHVAKWFTLDGKGVKGLNNWSPPEP